MHGWIDEWMDGSMDGHFLHSGHVDVDNYARNLPKTNVIHLCRLHLYLATSFCKWKYEKSKKKSQHQNKLESMNNIQIPMSSTFKL